MWQVVFVQYDNLNTVTSVNLYRVNVPSLSRHHVDNNMRVKIIFIAIYSHNLLIYLHVSCYMLNI